jgi:hypothetical protein
VLWVAISWLIVPLFAAAIAFPLTKNSFVRGRRGVSAIGASCGCLFAVVISIPVWIISLLLVGEALHDLHDEWWPDAVKDRHAWWFYVHALIFTFGPPAAFLIVFFSTRTFHLVRTLVVAATLGYMVWWLPLWLDAAVGLL